MNLDEVDEPEYTPEYIKFAAYDGDLETDPEAFTVISPDGDDFSDNNIIFDIMVEDLIMRSAEFANLTFEQDVNGLFVTTESLLSKFDGEEGEGPTDNQFDSDFNEGPIGDVRFLGTVDGGDHRPLSRSPRPGRNLRWDLRRRRSQRWCYELHDDDDLRESSTLSAVPTIMLGSKVWKSGPQMQMIRPHQVFHPSRRC